MVVVKAQPGESVDGLIRKFSKKVALSGLLQELKRKEFYQKPSELRKEKMKEIQRRHFTRRITYS